jgi:hypothetical protein
MRMKSQTLWVIVYVLPILTQSTWAHRGTVYNYPTNETALIGVSLTFPDAPYFSDEWYPVKFKVTNRSNKPLNIYGDMPIVIDFNQETPKQTYVHAETWSYPWEAKQKGLPDDLVTSIPAGEEHVFDFRRDLFTDIRGLRLGDTKLKTARVRFLVSSNECAVSNWAPIRFSERKMMDEPIILYGQTTQGTNLPYSAFRLCTLESRRFLYHQRIRAFEISREQEPRFERDVTNSLLKVYIGDSVSGPIIWNTSMMRIENGMQRSRIEQSPAGDSLKAVPEE